MLPIRSNDQTMTSVEIADLVESRHDSVKRTMDTLANSQTITFTQTVGKPTGGRPSTYYIVNKRDSYIVVAQLSPEFTAKLVDRWQELEEANQFQIPQTFAEALRLATDQAQQLEDQAPKVAYHDKVLAAPNGMTTTEIGTQIGMSAIKLNRLLKYLKIQRRVGDRWVLTAAYLNEGYATEETFLDEDSGSTYHSMKWTEAGRKFIIKSVAH